MDGRASPAMVSFPDPRSRHPFHMHAMIHGQPAFVEEAVRRGRSSDSFASLPRARKAVSRVAGCGGLSGANREDLADDALVIGSTHDRSCATTMSYTTQLASSAALPVQGRPHWPDADRGISQMPAVL